MSRGLHRYWYQLFKHGSDHVEQISPVTTRISYPPWPSLAKTRDWILWQGQISPCFELAEGYDAYSFNCRQVTCSNHNPPIFIFILKCYVSLKVFALFWGVILDSLSTRVNLHKRGILSQIQGISCMFCFSSEEDSHHI